MIMRGLVMGRKIAKCFEVNRGFKSPGTRYSLILSEVVDKRVYALLRSVA